MFDDGRGSLDLLAQLREFDTALVANTIQFIDGTPPDEYYMAGNIQSVTAHSGPTVGVAQTCELDSSSPGNTAELDLYWEQLENMERERQQTVWVVKTVGSRPDHECALGDGMAKTLRAVGCLGVVTDGGVRDIGGLESISFAAYARGRTVHHCPMRFRSINRPVTIGGITIAPGEIVHADRSGVIRIPFGCLDKVPEKAMQVLTFEREAHMWLRRDDMSTAAKRLKLQELLVRYGLSEYDFAR